MIKSKYLGNTYDANWTVVAVELAGRYGKRKKTKGNSYRFFLARLTSDKKFSKSLCVSHRTMKKIDQGEVTVEQVEAAKRKLEKTNEFRNSTYYKFM